MARTAINIVILHAPGRCECNSRNEHLRASITVNVGQCVFIRETGRAKLEISSRPRPCAGGEGRDGGKGAREERRRIANKPFHADTRENFVWHLQPPLRE